MKTEILNTILSHFQDVKPKVNIFSNDARFREDLGVDSLDMAEFVARVEQDYRLEIPDQDWQKIATINMMADYILHAKR